VIPLQQGIISLYLTHILLSVGAGTISGGVYDGNWRLAADHWFYSTAGTGGVDWSNATGTFKTPTGVNTFGGIGLFPSTLFVVGTSALNYTTVTDLRASDDGYFTDAFAVGGTAALNVTTATTLTATDLIQGADGRFTDDALVDDDFYVDGTATVQDLVVNTTTDINGATTTRGITLDANSNLALSGTGTATAPTFLGNIKIPDFFSIGVGRVVDTNYTYPTGGKMDSIVMVDARSYNSTLTLLPAASAPGNLTIVKLQYAPGAYFAKINVTGGEHINGKDLVYTTDDSSTFLPSVTLWSSGTSWYVINVYGTWGSGDV
jgi:hypothetical protein